MSDWPELEQAAIRLLTNREHSRTELRRKLQARTEDTVLLDQVLDSLESNGYLSDERFTEQYVSYRKKKGFGPVRIRIELQERGISPDLVNTYADPGDDQWFEWLRECCRRKFGDALPDNFKAQAKCARFLEYRGFPSDLIRSYLRGGGI